VKAAPQVPDTGHLDPPTEAELRRHYGVESGAVGTAPAATGRHAAPEGEPAREWSATETSAVPVGAVSGGDEPPGPVALSDEEVAAAREAGPGGTDGAMPRSEERLRVGTERVPARRVRLVKYVVTEEVQVTVPVRREEVRLEELPLEGDAPPADEGESLVPDTGAGLPGEIVLHAERPVVSVEVVPVERVRLRVEEVAGEERVSDQVQREQIVVDRS
jgi:uncharacterized protein (TIGR02271 family)